MTDTCAIYFDGLSARRRHVDVVLNGGGLELREAGQEIARWPLGTLRELEALKGELKLRSIAAPELAHIIISDPATVRAVRVFVPGLAPDAIRHRTPAWKIVGLSMTAAASVLVAIMFVVPLMAGLLAQLVPPAVERKLGDQVAQQLRGMYKADVCSSPAGDRALGRLSAILTDATGLRHPVRISVLDTSTKNAVALPGGQIFLFDGLLQLAQSPDEIAGVLGHEIGHEIARDGLKGFFRSGGTAFLLGLLFGDVSGSWAVIMASREVIESAHSREAETRADNVGQQVLHSMGRPAAAVAELLVRISGNETKSIFDSHPLPKERLDRLRKADASAGRALDGPPLLSDGEWRALRAICVKD